MNHIIKYPVSKDEIIDIIHDNILFTAFKRQLVDVSNLIGGTNQEKISKLYSIGFEHLLYKMVTIEEMNDGRENQICELLKGIFNRHLELCSFSHILTIDQLDIATNIYSEWQAALNGFRNNAKSIQTQL
ncbi:hypothetical protein [Chryseobacterium mulctrae]|uniref:hypothetical protein n=1 Tax=Chryseobacterium mulctrae TaxID=2576777 RepID=UPI00111740E4|nr:hypothetical protein [Chryseobacterium mulctrae]